MKKFMSIILSFSLMIVCTYYPIYGIDSLSEDPRTETINNLQILLSSVSEEPEAYGMNSSDLTSLSLGSRIQTYCVCDEKLVEADSFLYPLFSDGELIAHITSFYIDNVLESMISTDLVDIVSVATNDIASYALYMPVMEFRLSQRTVMRLFANMPMIQAMVLLKI